MTISIVGKFLELCRKYLPNAGTVVVSVFFSAIVSSSLSYYVTSKVNTDKARLDYKEKQISNFIDSTTQFNTFAAAFAYDLSEKKAVNDQSKKELVENLNQQFEPAICVG
jgi:hypothetical protein